MRWFAGVFVLYVFVAPSERTSYFSGVRSIIAPDGTVWSSAEAAAALIETTVDRMGRIGSVQLRCRRSPTARSLTRKR